MGCQLFNIQDLLAKKWTILIMQELYSNKVLSFNQILKKLKTPTNRILSKRLHELEGYSFIIRKLLQEKPIKVEYSITNKGIDLMKVFNIMKKWGIDNKITPKICLKTNCNECKIRLSSY